MGSRIIWRGSWGESLSLLCMFSLMNIKIRRLTMMGFIMTGRRIYAVLEMDCTQNVFDHHYPLFNHSHIRYDHLVPHVSNVVLWQYDI